MLAELHEGICGNHPGGRTLAHRAHTQGYYWPTMRSDVADYTRKCDPCQRMSPILRSPAHDLVSISSLWPFAQWGIDIVGPFPIALAQKKLLLVATDYFNKWIFGRILLHPINLEEYCLSIRHSKINRV